MKVSKGLSTWDFGWHWGLAVYVPHWQLFLPEKNKEATVPP
jgi:hypothetical protein